MRPKQPAAIITGTMASPSSPSVRLTEFDAPTITKIAKGMKNQPSSTRKFFTKGRARVVASGSGVSRMIQNVATPATTISASSRTRAGIPLDLDRVSF